MVKQLFAVSGTLIFAVVMVARAEGAALTDEGTKQVALDREAVRLLERINEAGREIQFHADRLRELSTGAQVSEWSHYSHLDGIGRVANEQIRPDLLRLTALQTKLPGWKRDRIDRMVAAARELAADTTSAYFKKNTRPGRPAPINPEYTQLVGNLAAHARALVATADAAHAYAVGHLKATDAGLAAH